MTSEPNADELLRMQADYILDHLAAGTTAEETARTVAALTHLLAVGRAALEDLKAALHHQLGARESLVIDGVGIFTRTWSSQSTKWDHEGLRRWILDSRAPADRATGEIPDESPLDKVLACYTFPPSSAPSTTALKKRGMTDDQMDEFRTRDGKRPTVKVEGT